MGELVAGGGWGLVGGWHAGRGGINALAEMDRHTRRNGRMHWQGWTGTLGGTDGCTGSDGLAHLEERRDGPTLLAVYRGGPLKIQSRQGKTHTGDFFLIANLDPTLH